MSSLVCFDRDGAHLYSGDSAIVVEGSIDELTHHTVQIISKEPTKHKDDYLVKVLVLTGTRQGDVGLISEPCLIKISGHGYTYAEQNMVPSAWGEIMDFCDWYPEVVEIDE